jgi:cyclopropane-fatty-acyl-phospholipid synthase
MLDSMFDRAIAAVEKGWVPDSAIRWGIRRLCAQRLSDERHALAGRTQGEALEAFVRSLDGAEIAPLPRKANAQHYDVPPALFACMLGPRMKYSCCWWDDRTRSLADAEEASLALTTRRADVQDGMRILELGCGWGSLSLWMAERYPASRIVAVSNSAAQRTHIEAEIRRRRLTNLEVRTADMNTFHPGGHFDRIVSVEMFEHMRNHPRLFRRIHGWLAPGGRLFVHVFCHQRFAYFFEEDGAGNWMGRHFFSGGLMPSADLLPAVPGGLAVEQEWRWDGRHYERTANAWLENLDLHREEALRVLAAAYGPREAVRWLGRWRIFLMACAELFGYAGGTEWGVAHYRFTRAGSQSALWLAS